MLGRNAELGYWSTENFPSGAWWPRTCDSTGKARIWIPRDKRPYNYIKGSMTFAVDVNPGGLIMGHLIRSNIPQPYTMGMIASIDQLSGHPVSYLPVIMVSSKPIRLEVTVTTTRDIGPMVLPDAKPDEPEITKGSSH